MHRSLSSGAAPRVAALFVAAGAATGAFAGVDCGCISDTNGDGIVDGNDLTAVLGGWGSASAVADLNDDGTVDGDDLAIVLGQWGPCPAPENDLCTDALLIDVGVYPFCTMGAATDGPPLEIDSCGLATNVYNDIWYVFHAESTGTLTIETCDEASFDTVIAVYSAALPGMAPCPTSGLGLATYVGCNDDACAQQSRVVVNTTAGKSYKIRVGSYNPAVTGTGALVVTFEHPGESCANPITTGLIPAPTIQGSTVDNESIELPGTCFSTFPEGPSEWITYTAQCHGLVTFSTCHAETDFDTVLVVLRYEFDGNCWSTYLGCNDDTTSPACELPSGLNRKSRLTLPSSPGEVFRVVVSGFNGASGHYKLTITPSCN